MKIIEKPIIVVWNIVLNVGWERYWFKMIIYWTILCDDFMIDEMHIKVIWSFSLNNCFIIWVIIVIFLTYLIHTF